MRTSRLLAAILALTVGGSAVPLASGLIAPASATSRTVPSPVDITVSLDLPNGQGSAGPVVFERDGVVPGPGIEIDGSDQVSNPTPWGGSLTVDIDPTTHHITIAPDEPDAFQTAEVRITGGDITGISTVSDTLWDNPSLGGSTDVTPTGSVMDLVTTTASPGAGIDIAWHIDPVDATDFVDMDPHGSAVFAYTTASTTSTTVGTSTSTSATEPCAPSTTSAPTTSARSEAASAADCSTPTTLPAAPPATAVPAQPTYTG